MGNNQSETNAKRTKLMDLIFPAKIEELRDFLAQSGVDVNTRDATRTGCTTLMYAARQGSSQCLKVLLDAGANVNMKNKLGYTALWYALDSAFEDCADILLDTGADVSMADSSMSKLLMKAVVVENDRIVMLLLDAGADVNEGSYKPLIHATLHSNHQYIKLLLDAGADVNATDCEGRIALLSLSLENRLPIKCAQHLLKAGANVNNTNEGCNDLISHFNRNINPNENFVKLLYAAGESVDLLRLKKFVMGPRRPSQVAQWLLVEESRSGWLRSLKDLCRVSIRTYLLHLDSHSNLFVKVPRLGLPPLLARYLVFDMTLDTCEVDNDDSDHDGYISEQSS